MDSLLDPIRKKGVADTPEERVRQALLSQMLGPLAFPKSLIAVEKRLGPGRRADIIAYVKQGTELKPLLLIECKAERVDREAYWQASGYNAFLAAPFICLADGNGITTYWKEESGLKSVSFLPPYPQLMARIGCF
jgi:hypothetical protein